MQCEIAGCKSIYKKISISQWKGYNKDTKSGKKDTKRIQSILF